MYEFLEGLIAARTPARLVLDVGGVGWDLVIPLTSTFPDQGRARVWTHFVVREDAQVMYGFPDRETRELFRLLLSVRGVGPAMALGVLSGLPREALLEAIAAGDVRTLTRIKGIGKKTAEQINLDLREKAVVLRLEQTGAPSGSPGAPSAGDPTLDDAVGALVSIGYSEKEARKAVERAAEKVDRTNLEALVRAALAG